MARRSFFIRRTAAALARWCVFAVAARGHRRRRWGWGRLLARRRGGGGSGPAVCIGQVHAGLEGDGCLWRKGILMGEKCQPPDFSGAIIYDAAGNVVKKPLR
ncbi:unnamed protein product [Spirodela intermedia]|uniref:Uncharacterized protein n=1 Tax=Spirodela intermedia TaxID=51605 RepID=A0A7I8LJC6_SPIIN|nr:unnamed protein product [Spirodela intermedia]